MFTLLWLYGYFLDISETSFGISSSFFEWLDLFEASPVNLSAILLPMKVTVAFVFTQLFLIKF